MIVAKVQKKPFSVRLPACLHSTSVRENAGEEVWYRKAEKRASCCVG